MVRKLRLSIMSMPAFQWNTTTKRRRKKFTYPLIYKGDERIHTYKVVGAETVQTGQGPVEALVVERERESKSRKTRLYVAPSLDYLLVKIEHQENRLVKIVATLKHMDYELAGD